MLRDDLAVVSAFGTSTSRTRLEPSVVAQLERDPPLQRLRIVDVRLGLRECGPLSADRPMPSQARRIARRWHGTLPDQPQRALQAGLEALQQREMGCIANGTARLGYSLIEAADPGDASGTADLLDVRRCKLAAFDSPELRRRHPGRRGRRRQADAGGLTTIAELASPVGARAAGVRCAEIRASLHRRHGASVTTPTLTRPYRGRHLSPAAPARLSPMKGLVLAGGTATRLFPLTIVTNKHLLPIYDRPMIYYPLDTLAGMGIREVMVIVGGKSVGDIVELLGDGRHFGLDLTYRYQRGALGIAHAIGLARDFIGGDSFCVVLGDNILRGEAARADGAHLRRGSVGRRHPALPRARPAALRRRGARRGGQRRRVRGEARPAQVGPDPDRRLLPAPGRVRRDRDPRAVGPRRVRDHRRPQPLHPRRRPVHARLRRALGRCRHRALPAAGRRARGGRRRSPASWSRRRPTPTSPDDRRSDPGPAPTCWSPAAPASSAASSSAASSAGATARA